ncbi:hypothetical protein [Oricola sp.]|uniref:hypothetical protein n=1 Tax=Oricola sp. TaxID=1979950 RepID=UPI0025D04209|nr:hypothetical protein [Oricola sp.]MCI5075575.1 hypothetical protein [Oricola sp.]
MSGNRLDDQLFHAVDSLETTENARKTAETKFGRLLNEFGGSYTLGNAEKMRIASVSVSFTGSKGNLPSAWKRKAGNKLGIATKAGV